MGFFEGLGLAAVFAVVIYLNVKKASNKLSRRRGAGRSKRCEPFSGVPQTSGAQDAVRLERERQLAARQPERPKVDFTYRARKPLHDVEQQLYWKLRLAIPSYTVLTQVAMSQIVEPVPNTYEGWNPIAQKVVDFLVLRRDFSPLCVIELDGVHHLQQRQQEKDVKRDAALRAAGVTVIRWRPREVPSGEAITKLVKDLDSRSV